MDDFGFGGERPRRRFIEKAARAGFHESMSRWRPDLVGYSLHTMALVWPEEAYAFNQVIIRGRQIKDVAAEKEVDVRTIHRRLAGHEGKPGAEDWLLIILQLYREADFVNPGVADKLRDCFLSGDSEGVGLDACLRVFFLVLVEATAGSDLRTILDSVPWRSTASCKTLAWPCYAGRPPLEQSLLPGVLAALQGAQDVKNRLGLALLASFLSVNEPRAWQELLAVLNTGGCRSVAERGRIAQEHLAQAEESACLLLSNRSLLGSRAASVRYGLLGVLAWTPLSWDRLSACANDATLCGLAQADRLRHCTRLYMGAQHRRT